MKRIFTVVILAAALTSCSSSQTGDTAQAVEQKVEETATMNLKGMVELDLMEHGIPGSIYVPDKSKTGVDPSVIVDDVNSMINIRSGKNYNVFMREEDMSMDMVKADLESDIMFKNEIVEETATSLLFKRILPDGSGEFYHFAMVMEQENTIVVARSNEMGEYSQKQVKRMLNSAETLKMHVALASN